MSKLRNGKWGDEKWYWDFDSNHFPFPLLHAFLLWTVTSLKFSLDFLHFRSSNFLEFRNFYWFFFLNYLPRNYRQLVSGSAISSLESALQVPLSNIRSLQPCNLTSHPPTPCLVPIPVLQFCQAHVREELHLWSIQRARFLLRGTILGNFTVKRNWKRFEGVLVQKFL